MSVRHLTLSTLLAAISLTSFVSDSAAANRREPFELLDGDRVVLLGGTFFERAQRYGYLETAMQLRFPDRKFSVRNLGWSGDTVFAESRGIFDPPAKGYARMIDQAKGLKPTVIFLHYGENESFNGMDYVPSFVKQYEKLLDDLNPTGAEIVLLSPRPLFHLGPPYPDPTEQNENRLGYAAAIKQIAERRGLRFVELFPFMKTDLRAVQERWRPTDDGQQLNHIGYGIGSTRFQFNVFGPQTWNNEPRIELNADGSVIRAEHCEVSVISRPTEKLRFKVTFDQPSRKWAQLKINGLPEGEYEIRNDGKPLGWRVSAERFARAFEDAGKRGLSVVVQTPDLLRETVIEKNQMYFHRWRPQNVTYLFLFRKHEQGNNAKEVEEFERIVAKLDDRIFELKQKPVEVTVEIVRVGDADSDQ